MGGVEASYEDCGFCSGGGNERVDVRFVRVGFGWEAGLELGLFRHLILFASSAS